jgi:hypothetical protein
MLVHISTERDIHNCERENSYRYFNAILGRPSLPIPLDKIVLAIDHRFLQVCYQLGDARRLGRLKLERPRSLDNEMRGWVTLSYFARVI